MGNSPKTTHPSTEWVPKPWHSHTMEYSQEQNEQTLLLAIPQMCHTNVMLSEIRQTGSQKLHGVLPLKKTSKADKTNL